MNKYITEFIGTFFLVLVVGLTAVYVKEAAALAALAIGGTLMVMIFMGGHISGGHYNPAVTLACLLRGATSWGDAAAYWVVQIAGGLAGAFLAAYLVIDPVAAPAFAPAHVVDGTKLVQALINEVLFTFALASVVLNTATSKDHPNNSFYGLAIGFTVVCGAIAGGGISGGAYNPAVGIGHIVKCGQIPHIWVYIAAPLVGGLLAAIVFRVCNPHEYNA